MGMSCFCLITFLALDNTCLFMSLTAGAGTRCMSLLFGPVKISWEHVLESLSHTRNEEHMDEDREDRRDPRKVLVSDCLSDPQKNSSITCGFPFLFFFKYLSF